MVLTPLARSKLQGPTFVIAFPLYLLDDITESSRLYGLRFSPFRVRDSEQGQYMLHPALLAAKQAPIDPTPYYHTINFFWISIAQAHRSKAFLRPFSDFFSLRFHSWDMTETFIQQAPRCHARRSDLGRISPALIPLVVHPCEPLRRFTPREPYSFLCSLLRATMLRTLFLLEELMASTVKPLPNRQVLFHCSLL